MNLLGYLTNGQILMIKQLLGKTLNIKMSFYTMTVSYSTLQIRSFGHVLEFGPGTGNLTVKLLNKGLPVIGVEPSARMRKLVLEKTEGRAKIVEGDFLNFPQDLSYQTIASSYAFHHLTDEEKALAVSSYSNLLPSGGKIVFADTMYESVEAYKRAITDASAERIPSFSNGSAKRVLYNITGFNHHFYKKWI